MISRLSHSGQLDPEVHGTQELKWSCLVMPIGVREPKCGWKAGHCFHHDGSGPEGDLPEGPDQGLSRPTQAPRYTAAGVESGVVMTFQSRKGPESQTSLTDVVHA